MVIRYFTVSHDAAAAGSLFKLNRIAGTNVVARLSAVRGYRIARACRVMTADGLL